MLKLRKSGIGPFQSVPPSSGFDLGAFSRGAGAGAAAALGRDGGLDRDRVRIQALVEVRGLRDTQHAGADLRTQSLQRLQADQRYITESLASDLRRIHNEAELKRWLKEQWQLAKATSA